MKKIDDVHWVDFVRGVAESESEQEIREQLAAGAGEEQARCWRRLAALGRNDLAREIPDEGDYVRIAKAMGSLQRAEDAESQDRPLERLAAELVFNSADQPAPVGARSHEMPARHMVFETEQFILDIRVKRPLEDARSDSLPGGILNGQIFRRLGDPQPVLGVPVLVYSGDGIVSSTRSDDFGEFHAENVPTADLKLCLLVDRESCIEISL